MAMVITMRLPSGATPSGAESKAQVRSRPDAVRMGISHPSVRRSSAESPALSPVVPGWLAEQAFLAQSHML